MEPPGKPGFAVLQSLLLQSPVEAAEWVLDQVRALAKPKTDVQTTQLFHLAGVFSAVPPQQRQALVAHTLKGYLELPAERKAEVVKMAMRHARLLKHAAPLAQPATMPPPNMDPSCPLKAPFVSNFMHDPAGAAKNPGDCPFPLVANLMQVVAQARLDLLPRQEVWFMQHAVVSEAVRAVARPRELFEVVQELDAKEREALTQTLVEANVVAPEQQELLERVVRPGGYTDQLADAVYWASVIRANAWVAILWPCVEFGAGVLSGYLSCYVDLANWLRDDAYLGLAAAIAAGCSLYSLSPALSLLQEDPLGAAQRVQRTAIGLWGPEPPQLGHGPFADLRPLWKAAVPSIPFNALRIGLASLVIAAAFVANSIHKHEDLRLLQEQGTGTDSVFIGARLFSTIGLVFVLFNLHNELNDCHRIGSGASAEKEPEESSECAEDSSFLLRSSSQSWAS